jgi:hypothetical protein
MMETRKNPFEYEGANNLPDEDIISFYIEDYNFSRTIHSTRNIYLIGERGSGKTMTLLYNSFKIQYKKLKVDKSSISLDKIGIYIPCNTPLFHKKEYEFLASEPFKASILGEHYLTLAVLYYICETLEIIDEIKDSLTQLEGYLFDDLEYMLGIELKRTRPFFESLKLFIAKENSLTQKRLNNFNSTNFYDNSYTFSSLAIPFFEIIKKIPALTHSHFLLMIDDAHDLNSYQIRTINSWVAYRDHSTFSFKIATAKVNRPELITATGGSILEGHDFITIDMEKPFQNESSDFYKLAKDIVEKRLANIGNNSTAEEYFPINPDFEKDLAKAEELTRKFAKEKYPNGTTKQVNDFVYKYRRAEYFRSRPPQANIPPFSGFQTIVDISTGVIRNLLDPCYYMFESELDRHDANIKYIPYATQTKIIIDRSRNMWLRLSEGLHKEVEGCSMKQAKEINSLFEQLMILFDKRLKKHKSEPRAISFTISLKDRIEEFEYVTELLRTAQKAQLLYTRLGNAKDDGKQEIYYVPNRLLFPLKGLDPHGQFARVSLKSTDLFNATRGIPIPFIDDDTEPTIKQGDLF